LHGTKHFLWLFGGAFLALLAPEKSARADGDDFFEAQEIPGIPVYVVFGSVKDDRGNYLSNAVVTVEVAEPVLIYETTTNLLGRFRTVDVGRAVTDLGYDVDPAQIEVSVSAPGYVPMRRLKRGSPRRKQGAAEIDFVMKREK
jgi:hypothetical protein